MTVRVFVDTNVLVYARDASAGDKQNRAAQWLAALWRDRTGVISTQVLHEYYAAVTRKLKPGLSAETAREDIRNLSAWRPVTANAALLEQAWAIEDRYKLSFWDATIVAAAVQLECTHLLTEDLQDGQSFSGVEVISPFTHAPD